MGVGMALLLDMMTLFVKLNRGEGQRPAPFAALRDGDYERLKYTFSTARSFIGLPFSVAGWYKAWPLCSQDRTGVAKGGAAIHVDQFAIPGPAIVVNHANDSDVSGAFILVGLRICGLGAEEKRRRAVFG